jgi:predicted alpha/beta-fold hydrolase
LAGYRDALDYYDHTAAKHVIEHVQVPALILSASNDPIVPVACFEHATRERWPDYVRLIITRCGGHVGFIGRGQQRHWMDGLLDRWFQFEQLRAPQHNSQSHNSQAHNV